MKTNQAIQTTVMAIHGSKNTTSLSAGNIFRNARVELIEGRIIEMPPQMEPHAVGVILWGAL